MTGAAIGSDPPRPVLPADVGPREVMLWAANVINAHDAEALHQVYGSDTVHRLPTGTRRGADAIVASWRSLFDAVPDTTLTILALVAQDDTVFMRWRLTGTHTGADLEGIVAAGARISVDGIDHVTVSGRTITSTVAVFDRMQIARQLGVLPSEGSRVEVAMTYVHNALTRRRRRG